MTKISSAIYWISIYLAIVFAPLFVLLLGPVPPGSGFWWDFSMALGFTAIAMMGVQFILTARFRRVVTPFGIDIVYFFHRYLGVMALTFIVVHYLIIRINRAEVLGALNPLQAPWYMTLGRLAFLLFATIIITSLWRKRLKIHYDEWRMLHIGLSTMGFILALGHIEGVSYYIDAPVKHALWISYIIFWLLLIVYVRLVKPWQMHNRPYRVVEVQQECNNCCTLVLEPIHHKGINFNPGQFAWLTLRASPFHIKEHPFSISSSAAQQGKVAFTIKALGDFTRTIKDTQVGETAYLDGPYGVFSTDCYPAAPGFVFIAGGIGAAPIMSMLRTMADRHEQRPLLFIYANDSWDNVIFKEELDTLKTRLNLNLVHVLKEPAPGWNGESGFVTPELLQKVLLKEAQEYEYFLCGPKPMSNAVQQGLHNLKVPLGRVHFELFDMV
ncbi:MAG: ferric reductase-like transmembrane domain-containing protein [Gammaproteobacteria bacterium]|nr:ferric reductase-like transmembrane domain-containing protein [Gammaproteobacteria bacterium]MCW8986125.1 ferric reductase-like transmembrane domain-containing protein [Gammaproteobacteria bacterium]MCW9031899.1 ferric reductase-like transmembrane domain-containing protein [Gammaproteobacteria bacterium]